MIKRPFYLLLTLQLFVQLNSQTLTKKDIVETLQGKWQLLYKNELLKPDSTILFEKRMYDFSGTRGKEIGYWKDGRITRMPIKWKVSKNTRTTEFVITFVGGLWTDKQEFIVKNVTIDKMVMSSCDKYENCDELYFIKK